MSPSPRKEKQRDSTREEIKTAAWGLLAAGGVEALSLNAIARQMGVTTPALYRYFNDRADLLAALAADAYASLAADLEAACAGCQAGDFAGRLRAAGLTYREWALANPERYRLIFGSSQPGLPLPTEAGQQADRSFLILLNILGEAQQTGKIRLPAGYPSPSPALLDHLQALSRKGTGYDPGVFLLALALWSKIHGLTSLEIYGKTGYLLGEERAEFFRAELAYFLATIGLE